MGDGCLPKAEPLPDLGSKPFNGRTFPRQIVPCVGRNSDLEGHIVDGFFLNVLTLSGEMPLFLEEL
jgi:hypothetical protein